MARPRKLWSCVVGRHGEKVRVYEPRFGAPVRWDWRDAEGVRHRPEVNPPLVVRPDPAGPVDPGCERQARDACRKRQEELQRLANLRRASDPEHLTHGAGWALFFDPKREALPPSPQARTHYRLSRAFWELELRMDTPWDAVKPADVEGALKRLIAKGQYQTAAKRLANLRHLTRWLRDRMDYDTLRDPTRGVEARALLAGYEPRRPRYTPQELQKLFDAAPRLGERFALFVTLLREHGARGGQIRLAMRSGLDCALEPPPPPDFFPHGWLMLPGVKHQRDMLLPLTRRAREAIDAAIVSYLAPWEAEYQDGGADYPLIPGGRTDRELLREPISDNGLRKLWPKMEQLAGVPKLPRRVFHGGRRSWVDEMRDAIGVDATAHAGGWGDTDMVQNVYSSPRRYADLERARRAREGA